MIVRCVGVTEELQIEIEEEKQRERETQRGRPNAEITEKVIKILHVLARRPTADR